MARKRQIDPGIWVSEQFLSLDDFGARLLFIGLISNADDEGRMKAGAKHLKAIIFPCDELAITQVQRWRQSIAEAGLIIVYSVNGTEYLRLPEWHKHQYMTKRFKSSIPEPLVNDKLITGCVQVAENDMETGIGNMETGIGNMDDLETSSPPDDICRQVPSSDRLNPNPTVALSEGSLKPSINSQKPICNGITTTRNSQSKLKESKGICSNFNVFYAEYPKKKDKAEAIKAFTKLKPDDELLETILTAIRKQKTTDDWLKDNGNYIPLPSTYLNHRRWEDEIVPGKEPNVRKPNYAN